MKTTPFLSITPRRFNARSASFLLPLLLTTLAAPPARAWGVVGHAVVADLAEKQLQSAVAQEVRRLLALEGARHLADVASWADKAKREGLTGSPSHTIRLPLDGSTPPSHPCPGHFCADDALAYYGAVLADRTKPDADREVALKYIVHLVGDLQQPLHAVDATGSKLKVRFQGRASELHAVWDDGIIDAQGHSAGQLARELTPLAAEVPAGGGPLDWAEEGRQIAQTNIYVRLDPQATGTTDLPADYAQRQWPVVARRLAQGGDRLAALLNRLLGGA